MNVQILHDDGLPVAGIEISFIDAQFNPHSYVTDAQGRASHPTPQFQAFWTLLLFTEAYRGCRIHLDYFDFSNDLIVTLRPLLKPAENPPFNYDIVINKLSGATVVGAVVVCRDSTGALVSRSITGLSGVASVGPVSANVNYTLTIYQTNGAGQPVHSGVKFPWQVGSLTHLTLGDL